MPGKPKTRLIIRCELNHARLGPGKIQLLEAIGKHGSISEAARSMEMSYRRAWLLVAELNQSFRTPVTAAKTGGKGGGKAELTPFGRDLIRRYRAIERDATAAVTEHLDALAAELAEGASGAG